MTHKSPDRNNLDEEAILFLHIGKTGGRTLDKILERHFRPSEICPAYLGEELRSFSPEQLNNYRLFRGHFTYDFIQFLPGHPRVMTFLREPVSRAISNYQHILRDSNHSLHEEFVSKDVSPYQFATRPEYNRDIDNWMTLVIAGKHDVELAKERLQQEISYFGLTERYRESVNLLTYTFGWDPVPEYGKENVTPNKLRREQLSAETIRAIEDANQLDIELYKFASELFNERILHMIEQLQLASNEKRTEARRLSGIRELSRDLGEARDTIEAMTATRGWRALQAWWKFKN